MHFIEAVGINWLLDDQSIAGSIDFPRPGSRTDRPAIEVSGWVLGWATPVVAVELVRDGYVFRRIPLRTPRPDVAAAFPTISYAGHSGFLTQVPLVGLGELGFTVRAVLADQKRCDLAAILLRRRWPEDAGAESTPLVSVIVPCFRQAEFLGEALQSVCSQSYPHYEVIVVDDGSPDNAAAVARQFPGVQVVRQSNMGLAEARNTGIRESRGDFLVFLDSDDRLFPTAIEAGLAAFRVRPDAAFVFGRPVYIGFDGGPLPTPSYSFEGDDAFEALLGTQYIECLSTVLLRRSVIHAMEGFRSSAGPCTDLDLYLRVARNYPIHYHGTEIMQYRFHGANMSGGNAATFSQALPVFRSHWKYARTNRKYRRAFKRGLKFRMNYAKDHIVNAVTSSILDRSPTAARDVLEMLCWYPLGALRLASRLVMKRYR